MVFSCTTLQLLFLRLLRTTSTAFAQAVVRGRNFARGDLGGLNPLGKIKGMQRAYNQARIDNIPEAIHVIPKSIVVSALGYFSDACLALNALPRPLRTLGADPSRAYLYLRPDPSKLRTRHPVLVHRKINLATERARRPATTMTPPAPPFPPPTGVFSTHSANCHCGAVRWAFSISPPLESYPVVSCNCSICQRNGYLLVYPDRQNVVLGPGARDSMGSYSFGNAMVTHQFCTKCGSSVFLEVKAPPPEAVAAAEATRVKLPDIVGVNVSAGSYSHSSLHGALVDERPNRYE